MIAATVVIATYNREEELARAIRSVLGQDFDDFELLVVDQTTRHSPAIESYLREETDPRFHYFRVAPPSLPAARNFGLAQAQGKVIVYVDDDVELEPKFLEAHFKAYDEDERIGAVAGRVITPGMPRASHLMRITRAGINQGGLDYDRATWIDTAQGCNMSFLADALREIGGFDTSYVGNAYREESDACYRLRRLGYKIAFRPDAALVHHMARTGGSVGNRDTILDQPAIYRNETLFFLKHQPKVLLPYFIGRQLRQFVFARRVLQGGKSGGRLVAFVRGFVDGIRAYQRRPSAIVAKAAGADMPAHAGADMPSHDRQHLTSQDGARRRVPTE